MEMMQYKPWEKKQTEILIGQSRDSLPILDVQLGGGCNLRCTYCDTPKYGIKCNIDLNAIERLIIDGDIRWVYICGLGEPTVPENIGYLKQILEWCREKGIGVSAFSNMVNVDDEIFSYIDDETYNVLFKLDTFDREKMTYLYGLDKVRDLYKEDPANIILRNYDRIIEVVHCRNGITNLGASIVPTSVNYSELPSIIDWCMEKDIFPFIGQLEEAGCCSKNYNELEVKEEDLIKFRDYISDTYNVNYEIPICPATISGVHVDINNKVILDKKTGLSCPWFWLGNPQLGVIGDIQTMSYEEIVKRILEYRASKFQDVEEMESHIELYPFGGCGGNVKQLLKTYVDVSKGKR